MSKIKKITILLIFLFVLPTNLFAENKVAYLDLDFILSNTNVGKILFEEIQKLESSKIKELNNQEQIL